MITTKHHIFAAAALGVLLLRCDSAVGQNPQAKGQNPAAGGGAKTSRQDDVAPKRPVEVINFVSEALAAPPEFAADALLKLAESNKITDAAWKRELLEEAFRIAGAVQEPVKRENAEGNVDTRTGYLALALNYKLDALSLRCRAVRAMLKVDKARARELFGEISPKLQLGPLGCENPLVFDVSDFYETLSEVILVTFDDAQRRRGEHVPFVQPYLSGISSPAQVGPAARLILSLKPTADELALLAHTFSAALKGVARDPRSFSYPPARASLLEHGTELVKACERLGVGRSELVESLRTYIIQHLGAGRCSAGVRSQEQSIPEYIVIGNRTWLSAKPITLEDIRSDRTGGTFKVSPFWRSAPAKRLLLKVKRLRFGGGQTPLALADKEGQQWQQELGEFLNELSEWNAGQEESEIDYFHQKSVLYKSLYELVPPGPKREAVLRDYVSFLTSTYSRQQSQVEWYLHARDVLEWARSSEGSERRKKLALIDQSGNAVLLLYRGLMKLLPENTKAPIPHSDGGH